MSKMDEELPAEESAQVTHQTATATSKNKNDLCLALRKRLKLSQGISSAIEAYAWDKIAIEGIDSKRFVNLYAELTSEQDLLKNQIAGML